MVGHFSPDLTLYRQTFQISLNT